MAKFKSLNIGDTVRVVSLADTGARCGAPPTITKYVGGTFEVTGLARQPSSGRGQVKLSNEWWFSPKGLEVLTPTEPTVTAEPTAPTGDEHGVFVTPVTPVGTTVVYSGGDGSSAAPEPVVHTEEDFKYTRVLAKGTGAEGVVVGRSIGGNVAVLHDETSDIYHAGNACQADFVGVPKRILYYSPDQLDIIGGV